MPDSARLQINIGGWMEVFLPDATMDELSDPDHPADSLTELIDKYARHKEDHKVTWIAFKTGSPNGKDMLVRPESITAVGDLPPS